MEYEEIQAKMKIIRESPINLIPDEKMAKLRKEMAKKCPITKKMDEEMRKHIAWGTEHQLTIKDPFVLTIKKSSGTRMWDMDDNEYIDWLMSSGACILGHNFPPLREEIIKVYQDLDPNIYYNNEWEIKSVEMIKKYENDILTEKPHKEDDLAEIYEKIKPYSEKDLADIYEELMEEED